MVSCKSKKNDWSGDGNENTGFTGNSGLKYALTFPDLHI